MGTGMTKHPDKTRARTGRTSLRSPGMDMQDLKAFFRSCDPHQAPG